MIRYLTLNEIIEIHRQLIQLFGNPSGILDVRALESAITQPRMTFEGSDLHETICEKAAALGFFIILNHPFVDGNKRVGHAAMEIFLVLNGYEIDAPIDKQEQIILDVAAGSLNRSAFTEWVCDHIRKISGSL